MADDVHAEWEIVDRYNHPAAPPDKKEHGSTWNEYEPHTTSMMDQWQGLHHEWNAMTDGYGETREWVAGQSDVPMDEDMITKI